MRKPTSKAILTLVILLNINMYSQKNFINFDKIKVENISSIEENFNSKVYESKLEYVESTKDSIIRYGKLKNYSRPENKLYGKIKVTYFYLKKDSIVRKINYSWIAPENSKIEDYNKQFDKTVKNISDELDLPIGEQGKLTKKIDDFIDGNPVEMNERRVTLKYKDTKILILIVWSEKHGAYISTSVEWEK